MSSNVMTLRRIRQTLGHGIDFEDSRKARSRDSKETPLNGCRIRRIKLRKSATCDSVLEVSVLYIYKMKLHFYICVSVHKFVLVNEKKKINLLM